LSLVTVEELARLASDGLTPGSRIWVWHRFSHFGSSLDEHAAFHASLRAAGFGRGGEIDAVEELTGDGYWHHSTYTAITASAAECERLDAAAQGAATEQGVRYDGWSVARDREGRPRDMSGNFLRGKSGGL
jgi:hypothetical protein